MARGGAPGSALLSTKGVRTEPYISFSPANPNSSIDRSSKGKNTKNSKNRKNSQSCSTCPKSPQNQIKLHKLTRRSRTSTSSSLEQINPNRSYPLHQQPITRSWREVYHKS
jgi:hypothetical protein